MTPEAIWSKVAEYLDGETPIEVLAGWLEEEGWELGPADDARPVHDAALLSIAEFDHGDISEPQLREDFRRLLRTVLVRYTPGHAAGEERRTTTTASAAVTSKPPFSVAGTRRAAALA